MTLARTLTIGTTLLMVACVAQTDPTPPQSSSSSRSSVAPVSSAVSSAKGSQAIAVVAENLRIPWQIVFLPSGDFLVTDRSGQLLRIGADRKNFPVEGVRHRGEGGLLGVTLHPDFAQNNWLYLYLTTEENGRVENRVERYTLTNDALTEEAEILAGIPGSNNHDGGRLAFGPDGKLYVTTGDAEQSALAQDANSLAGKILRLNDDGGIPGDNPFGNAVWSYGHRNPQGLAWDDDGMLWSTEHGRSIPLSGYDELNLIQKGGNYGWPDSQGDSAAAFTVPPVLHSGADDTWAPASLAFLDGSLWFGGLKGATLYQVTDVSGTPKLIRHFEDRYGRIREVAAGPDGFLYVSTSNTDGRGAPKAGDDRILRIDPTSLREGT